LKINAEYFSETSESYNAVTQRQIAEKRNLQLHCCKNLKTRFWEETAVVISKGLGREAWGTKLTKLFYTEFCKEGLRRRRSKK